MIEFVPPREGAFGPATDDDVVGFDPDDTGFDDEPSGPRWASVLAGCAVLGLLAAGVITAAPWSGTAGPTPAPATTVPPPPSTTGGRPPSLTSVPATDPTLPPGMPTEPAGWIPDAGSSWTAVFGASFTEGRALGAPSGAVLYASPDGVGRTPGRWVAAVASPSGPAYDRLRAGGVATTAGDRPAIVSVSPAGVVRVDVAVDREPAGSGAERLPTTTTVTGSGIALAALLSVAAGVELVETGGVLTADVAASLLPGGPLEGLEPLPIGDLRLQPWSDRASTPRSLTQLVDPDRGTWATVSVGGADALADLVTRLLLVDRIDPGELTLDVERRLDDLARRGLRVELGRLASSGAVVGEAVLPDGSTLVVSGLGDVRDTLDLVAELRPASGDEWVELLIAGANGGVPLDSGAAEAPPVSVIGRGGQWWAEVVDGMMTIGGPSFFVQERFTHGQGPQLVEYRSIASAFLLATTTFPDDARRVTVSQGDGEPRSWPLREIRGTGVLAAVVELDPLLPVTVTWSSADGTPVDGPVDAAAAAATAVAADGEGPDPAP